MDNNNPISLKASVFGGYKKKDVLSYIFELNESTQEAQQKFAEQIEELSESREALVKELAEAQTKLTAVQADFDETSARLDEEILQKEEASKLAEKYKREADAHFKNAVQKDGDIKRCNAINAELSEKNRVFEEKRAEVELAASQIATLLSKAQDDAGRLIGDAEAEAEKIVAAARREADNIIRKAEESSSRRVKDANSAIDRVYSQFGDFCSELETIKTTIADTAAEMNRKMDALNSTAIKTRDNMPGPSDTSVSLSYTRVEVPEEDDSAAGTSDNAPISAANETSPYADDILNKYGVRRDDSGFFRLAAER